MEKTNDKRIIFIDIARGLSILLMILGHTVSPGTIKNLIYSFHMPLFIIASGYFFKDTSFKKTAKKLATKLLLPTVLTLFIVLIIKNIFTLGILNSILSSIKSVLFGYSFSSKIIYNFNKSGALWFIYFIIGIRLLFLINIKISKNNDLLLFILILLESSIGYILGLKGYWLPWSFDVTLASMLFYFIGYLFKKYNLYDKLFLNKYIFIILLLLWIIGFEYYSIELATRKYPGGLLCYIIAICGSGVVFKLSKMIEEKFNCLTQLLSWCGKNSLYILLGHYIEKLLINYTILINNNILHITLISILKIVISVIIALIFIFFIKLKEKSKYKY